jgi:hypothetical protein
MPCGGGRGHNSEIINTVHARPASVLPASAGLRQPFASEGAACHCPGVICRRHSIALPAISTIRDAHPLAADALG